MNCFVLTLGSRGDVQPYVALALGLQHAGHTVTLATERGFESFVSAHGLRFAGLSGELLALAQSAQGKAALAGKGRMALLKQVGPMMRTVMDEAWIAAQGADVVIYHPKALAGYHIAEKLGARAILAMALPAYSPTAAFANPALGAANYGGVLNRLTHTLLIKAGTLPFRKSINAFRQEKLGLPAFSGDDLTLRSRPVTRLYGYSAHVLPRPADWDDSTQVTGYWFTPPDTQWQPSRELLEFLQAGPPPVYIGFGSMAAQDAESTTRIVLDAVRTSGQRAILASGWGGLTQVAHGSVFALASAPHDWLFPRCAAVVHHGGAGTTGAGLRAGKPTVICPFFGDQPFWGARVAALGVGPAPLPQKRLNAGALAAAISEAVNDPEMARRARELGAAISAEDGVARAVAIISA